jgi:hypothetical protein
MGKILIFILLFFSLLVGAYSLGRSHAELKIVEKEIEVVKYVDKKKAEIQARPNATRKELLELMRNNIL